ncbi:MAG: MBL fold metallo-hydrolase [Bacteroides sp.]|nr:MBL fold metallo-hydrolase [Bacteroides sp.]
MNRKKKNILIVCGVILTFALFIALYVLIEIGSLYSQTERAERYGKYSFYDIHTHQFVSPEELVFHPGRVTGGDAGFLHFFKKSPHAPTHDLPKTPLTRKDFPSTPSSYAFYWLGYSSLILELDGQRILIDPVLENAAPFPGLAQRYTTSPINRKELPDIDIVLITHDHYDHLEARTMRHLKKRNTTFIVPSGVGARLHGWGIPEEKIVEMAWEQTLNIASLQITATPAVHYSGRSKTDRNKTLWTGYAIQGKEKNIFWSGDSGYGDHFREIGKKYGPFDLACVEIDGWNDGWPNTHLFPTEVIQVCEDVHASVLLPVHWGVFDLALHPWNESIGEIYKLAEENFIEILTPLMGQKVIPGQTQTNRWW